MGRKHNHHHEKPEEPVTYSIMDLNGNVIEAGLSKQQVYNFIEKNTNYNKCSESEDFIPTCNNPQVEECCCANCSHAYEDDEAFIEENKAEFDSYVYPRVLGARVLEEDYCGSTKDLADALRSSNIAIAKTLAQDAANVAYDQTMKHVSTILEYTTQEILLAHDCNKCLMYRLVDHHSEDNM